MLNETITGTVMEEKSKVLGYALLARYVMVTNTNSENVIGISYELKTRDCG